MMNQKRDDPSIDDVVMSAAALALASPAENREAYIHGACGGDPELIRQVRDYLEWEERMDGFLEASLFSPDEPPFQRGDLADGRFDIVRDAGEGGMGWVYEGWDRQLNCRVAIKCSKAGFHKRLPPEVLHAREIAHRNVCRVFDIHTAQTRRGEIEFISMEFLEGETLAAQLAHARLSKKEALGLARQICAGLAEAHRQGVVHGDVKSNNVFITRDADGHERAVVADFGLARTPGAAGIRGTAQSMAGGAMDYVAPEVWNGGKATRASDVYGLGVVLCELFAGRRPFGPDARIEQRFQGKPPAMGTKWDRVLARCLEPDPARRFQSAAEVAEAIDPPAWPRYAAAAAAAVLLAAVGSVEMNRYLSKEPVRLALDPIEASSADLAGLAGKLTHDVAGQLAKIKGGDKFRLSLIPPEKARAAGNATNVLHVSLSRENGKLLVHASLTDERSRTELKGWTPAYAPGEERYVPVALAGMATESLGLPPLTVRPVNATASQDYWDGVWYTRQNSTLDNAIPALQRAVEKDGDSPLTWAALGEAQWFQYRYTKDLSWLDYVRRSMWQAESRDPDLAATHRLEGYLYYADSFYTKAQPEFERAISLDPTHAAAHIWLGKAYEDNNQYTEALKEFERATEAEPTYFVAWQNLAAYYQQRSKFSLAATYLEKAARLGPSEPLLRTYLAIMYRNLGRFPESEEQLQKDIAVRDTTAAEHGLGLTLMYLEKDADAVRHLQRALELDSPQAGVRKELVLMYLGIAQRRSQHLEEARRADLQGLNLAADGMRHSSRDGYIEAFVGYFSAALGRRSDAENYISSALGLFPDDSDTRWRAVLTYEELYRQFQDPALRKHALEVLTNSTPEQIADIGRWPDLKGLQADPDFKRLLSSHATR
jgi:serine/threonine protein kinase